MKAQHAAKELALGSLTLALNNMDSNNTGFVENYNHQEEFLDY